MRAVVFDRPGDEGVLRLADGAALPEPAAGEVRIRVQATSVNRADLLQRRGLYPPPPGASEVLGLECSGEVAALGAGVRRFAVGQRVMALLPGGGYAEEALVDAGSVMAVPDTLSLEEAGAFPEVFLTAFLGLFQLGQPPPRSTVLVHGGSGGVGTAAIRLGVEAGLRVLVTAGGEERCGRCRALGASAAFDHRAGDFTDGVLSETAGQGVAVVLDCIGARYLDANLRVLATGGRLVEIGLQGGARAEIDLAVLLRRRLSVIGSTLRARPVSEKAALVEAFEARFGPALIAGRLRPVVDRVLPLADAAEAHRLMQTGGHFGKIVLRVPG
jgi:putative PIG3 family NAD(P)H quinone oxidoreductase